MGARQDTNQPINPLFDRTITDDSGIHDKGLQVGGAATTENGLPVEPGTYRLKDGSIIVVGGGGVVVSRKK